MEQLCLYKEGLRTGQVGTRSACSAILNRASLSSLVWILGNQVDFTNSSNRLLSLQYQPQQGSRQIQPLQEGDIELVEDADLELASEVGFLECQNHSEELKHVLQ